MGLDDVQFNTGSFLSSNTSRASNKIPLFNVCIKKFGSVRNYQIYDKSPPIN